MSDRLNLFIFPSLYIKYTFLHKTLLLNEKNTTNVYSTIYVLQCITVFTSVNKMSIISY